MLHIHGQSYAFCSDKWLQLLWSLRYADAKVEYKLHGPFCVSVLNIGQEFYFVLLLFLVVNLFSLIQ